MRENPYKYPVLTKRLGSQPIQSEKTVKQLVSEGQIELSHVGGGCTYYGDTYPPYWGYSITEKIRSGEMYQCIKQEFQESEAKYLKDLEGLPYE